MSTLQFKTCNKDDLESMAEIFVAAFSKEPWNESWTKENAYIRLLNFYESPGFAGWVLKDNNQMIGMIVGQYQIYDTGWIFEIKDLCISEAYERRGLGRYLCMSLLGELDDKVKDVYLLTRPTLASYYQMMGFETQPMVYMQRPLIKA